MSSVLLIFSATLGLCAIFALFYGFARHINNYGIVDVVWSYAFAPLAEFFALCTAGWVTRRIIIATMVTVWSVRLGSHLCQRTVNLHPVEDGRYVQLRKDWAQLFAVKMAGFFQVQALSVVLLGAMFLVICANPASRLHWLELTGAGAWLIGIIGEALADAQLAAFRKEPTNKNRVCDIGLWRYSRHPNYFFEWVVWVAYFIFALASPWGWIGVVAPLSILYLLLRVTGIPLTEEQSLRSKGDAYRRYQRTTSVFVPWAPRKIP